MRSLLVDSNPGHAHRVMEYLEAQLASTTFEDRDMEIIQSLVQSLRRKMQLRVVTIEPNNFAARAWPAYLAAVGERDYYLSELELVLIAAMKKRNVMIFHEHEDMARSDGRTNRCVVL